MRIVITNDDGIDAPGLHRLAAAVIAAGHDVVVAAPRTEASGSGASLVAVSESGRVATWRRRLPGLDAVPAHAVAASPAYIAVLATLGAFGPPPDVLLSGINRGANAGHAILHSGTVGAAFAAAQRGTSAMAVSLDILSATMPGGHAEVPDRKAPPAIHDDDTRNWAGAAAVATDLLSVLAGAPAGTVLNLNVPDVPPDRLRGLRRAALARYGQVTMAIVESGDGFVRTTVRANGARREPGTDLALLAEGYASVTPLRAVTAADDVELDLSLPAIASHLPGQRTGGTAPRP